MKNFAFDSPVVLRSSVAPINTAEEAIAVLREHLRSRFTMAGLSTLLMLERAWDCSECAEARAVFHSWAAGEQV
mgnify:CR=1 FL=1